MTVLVVDFSVASAAGSNQNNPLNPLGLALRKWIWDSLEKAERQDAITSVVLWGGPSPRSFSAGADLTEFASLLETMVMSSSISPSGAPTESDATFSLPKLIAKIENYPKPVVAAISGNALGGGLEVALSCHYRICDAEAKFGLPEVHVGVIPGAGGTQRLPRVVGVAKALQMIVSGKAISSTEAQSLGLADHVCNDSDNLSLLEASRKWAEWAELMPLTDRRVGLQKVKESPAVLEAIFSKTSKQLPKADMGGEGVRAALAAVQACSMPIEKGCEVEFEHFLKTLGGLQGQARRHAFFAVRRAQKPLGKTPPKHHPLLQKGKRTSVAVVGAGLMGSGICMVLLRAGFTVHLIDFYPKSLEKGVTFLKSTLLSHVQKGRLPKAQADHILKHQLKPSSKLEDAAGCSLVVEAVIENMKIKQKIFAGLDQITPPECILLSNTSTLDIDEMASVVTPTRRERFAGWHFFSPAHVMKLVEIVVGKATSMNTVSVMQKLTQTIGKIGVVVGNCDGFVGNRLLISYGAETCLMLEEGVASVQSVDKAFLKFGIALGPFQMADLAGLDIGYNIRKQRGWIKQDGSPSPDRPSRYPESADVLVGGLNRLGQKNGKGWYTYDKRVGRGRFGLWSSEVEALVDRYTKPGQRKFSDLQMIERVLFPLVNEGFKCLEEGIANKPSDIDVVYLYGYGWPVYRGGPMFWADHEVGLKHLVQRLQEFHGQFPDTEYYKPSQLLMTCVEMNVTVEEYYNKKHHKNQSLSKL